MTQELWTAVDQYINETLISGDPILEAALQASETAGLPPIQVSPPQGKMLHILARSIRPAIFWKLARWVAIAPFGWRERFPRAGACSR